MSFQITPAYSSRVKRSRKQSTIPSLSSPSPRRKPPRRSTEPAYDDDDERLNDTGVIASLATDLNFRDVPQFMTYIRSRMFSPIPEKGAGMNSTRIAEVLNFRASLPPIVSLAHVDALSTSSTQIEREIVELAQKGVLRKISIPSRGVGAAAVGEGVVLVQEWEASIKRCEEMSEEVKSKYIRLMSEHKTSTTISGAELGAAEISALTTAGFLTNATGATQSASLFARPGSASLGSLSSLSAAGSKNASGSLGAVGGLSASQHISGGTGRRSAPSAHYNFSLPNTGSHIRLLIESRAYLLNLLKKSKYREAPMDVLHERWDGGVVGDDVASQTKKARGEFKGVLPGRTKKWRQFSGLRFEWVVEECVGAGLVEMFETGSVGVGIRAI